VFKVGRYGKLGFLLGIAGNPKSAGVLVGVVCLLIGFIALIFGNVPVCLVAIGIACLVFTTADIQIWAISVPAGLALIVAGILWYAIAPFVH
jgi:membrane-bound ClpP family serine protease